MWVEFVMRLCLMRRRHLLQALYNTFSTSRTGHMTLRDLARLVEALHPQESVLRRQKMQRVAAKICGMTSYVPGYMIEFSQFAQLNSRFLSLIAPAIDLLVMIRKRIFGTRWWHTVPQDAVRELRPVPQEHMYMESVPVGDWEAWAAGRPSQAYPRTAVKGFTRRKAYHAGGDDET